MLNPDGVVVGNYRTSLAGLDLNRVYKKPSRVRGGAWRANIMSSSPFPQELCPTVWSIKKMIEEMMEDREVCCVCLCTYVCCEVHVCVPMYV